MHDSAVPPAPTELAGQDSHESPSQYLFSAQFATHVVTSPPALVEPAAQSVHVPSLRYWFSEHDCARQTVPFVSSAPGTTAPAPVLKVPALQPEHSSFLAYMFAPHVHVVDVASVLVEPTGHVSQYFKLVSSSVAR